ncbi:MAG: hypothetical protein U0736_16320 [Gemmataceae bacterium]
MLLLHDGSPANSDLFQAVMTMLADEVVLGVAAVVPPGTAPHNGHSLVHQDEERARRIDRPLRVRGRADHRGRAGSGGATGGYDALILPLPAEYRSTRSAGSTSGSIMSSATPTAGSCW